MNYLSLYNDNWLNTLMRGFDYENSLFSSFGASMKRDKENDTLEIPLPGFKQSDVEISVENNLLKVSAKNKNGRQYSYSTTIGNDYDAEKAGAKMEDGVLEIKLPRKEKAEIKRIEIK